MLQFNFPTTILFGINAIKRLPSVLKERRLQKALLVTDSGIVKAGIADKVLKKLYSKTVTVTVFDE